jgi:2-polyprenyl-6-methoxyphenol hydroxylase-like FAD-dependent oxidoreductase
MHDKAEGRPFVDNCADAASEPGVIIPRSALREALANAERALDELHTQIRKLEIDRDNHVRRAGSTQELIDRLRIEADRRTSLVRRLASPKSKD